MLIPQSSAFWIQHRFWLLHRRIGLCAGQVLQAISSRMEAFVKDGSPFGTVSLHKSSIAALSQILDQLRELTEGTAGTR